MHAGQFAYPGFLTSYWFLVENASNLRKHVRNIVLRLLHEQAKDKNLTSVIEAVVDVGDFEANNGDK